MITKDDKQERQVGEQLLKESTVRVHILPILTVNLAFGQY
jgi:hypothetical protein